MAPPSLSSKEPAEGKCPFLDDLTCKNPARDWLVSLSEDLRTKCCLLGEDTLDHFVYWLFLC